MGKFPYVSFADLTSSCGVLSIGDTTTVRDLDSTDDATAPAFGDFVDSSLVIPEPGEFLREDSSRRTDGALLRDVSELLRDMVNLRPENPVKSSCILTPATTFAVPIVSFFSEFFIFSSLGRNITFGGTSIGVK